MDISTITDIDKLKALAFDQIQTLNQAQRNLQAIELRIAQLQAKLDESISITA